MHFAHESEATIARLFDELSIDWQYEPQTFAIRLNADGSVVESFTPDFFLPADNVFVEITTTKATVVRRKARKIGLLRDRYPDIRVKLFEAGALAAALAERRNAADAINALEPDLTADV